MGRDGLEGARRSRRRSVVFAEAEASCAVYGMPRAVAEAGLADRLIPIGEMAEAIYETRARGGSAQPDISRSKDRRCHGHVEVRKMYVSESQDRLQRMDGLLLALEQDGSDRGPSTRFREAHSIKGMSASMGYDELSKSRTGWRTFWSSFAAARKLERRSVDILSRGGSAAAAVEEIAAGGAPH